MDRQSTKTSAHATGPLERPVHPVRPLSARAMALDSPLLATPQTNPVPPEPVSSLPIEDLEVLLEAVRSRLRQAASLSLPLSGEKTLAGIVTSAQADVLDCVAALEQLHTALTRELGRSRDLEMTVFDTRTALAQLRGELEGTLAGERQARHQAMHDSLTSLPNRACFRERLDLAIAHANGHSADLAVVYMDLDGFKAINDQHGHAVGDEVLRIIALRLARAVRAADTVARLGGDEFGCLLTAFRDRSHLSQMAVKLFDAIAAPLKLDSLVFSVRSSIGIALCPTSGATADLLLDRADAAMYDAKRRQCGHAFDESGVTIAPR